MKHLRLVLAISMVMLLQVTSAYSGILPTIDTSEVNKGVIGVSYIGDLSTNYRVLIEKDDHQYSYYLVPNGKKEKFNLQLGNGVYTIGIYERISGNKYKRIHTEEHELKLIDHNQIYLQSVQNVAWDEQDEAIILAKALSNYAKSEEAKVTAIYEYIVRSFVYDYKKLEGLKMTYLPDIDTILKEKQGICYDFSSLFAAMLRSQGIPTKLVKGYSTKIEGYHSWNEVYDAKTKSWYIVDLTYDIQRRKQGYIEPMKKLNKLYSKEKEY